ncbi:MAG: hypothetical protein ACERKD_08620 [Prolixibacteraceae bacterium]
MKTYLLKKEKWYHTNYSIYQNGELIGEYLPEKFKKPQLLSLKDRKYSYKKKRFWGTEMELYLGNIKVAEIFPHSFKSKSTISLFSAGQFIFSNTNIWKGTMTLYEREKAIGECVSKSFITKCTISDSASEHLVAAMLFITQQRRNALIVFAALIPTFIAIFN